MGESADEAFANIRTVRIFAGEALAREGFTVAAADSRKAGLGFAKAKATLEGLNRGAIHVSLLALYALGGEPAAPPPRCRSSWALGAA
jgi:ATP-binding cassette subfamily B (MDR/TAP) protein 8